MSLSRLGETRSRRGLDHLLQTPDSFVWAPLPGMKGATAVVHASPAIGAGFVQYTALLGRGGEMGETAHSRFAYVLEGALEVQLQGHRHGDTRTLGETRTLEAGGFAYVPAGIPHLLRAQEESTRVAVIEKPFVPGNGGETPPAVMGMEAEVASEPLRGDEAVQVRMLLGADERFDFAVNTMEYRPGARLHMVESHVMEHGLLMLAGEGICRLGDAWYPVAAGDFVWMAPFCPQWFGALGDRPTRYLIYKDWNRHPALQQRDAR